MEYTFCKVTVIMRMHRQTLFSHCSISNFQFLIRLCYWKPSMKLLYNHMQNLTSTLTGCYIYYSAPSVFSFIFIKDSTSENWYAWNLKKTGRSLLKKNGLTYCRVRKWEWKWKGCMSVYCKLTVAPLWLFWILHSEILHVNWLTLEHVHIT